MSNTITRATVHDAQSVASLLRACWAEAYGGLLSPEALALIAQEWHHPDLLCRQITNPRAFFGLARTETGALVGVATVKQSLDGAVLSVQRLYVLASYQRQGIGSQLLSAALAAFPVPQRLELEVLEDNLSGRAFWAKQGFLVSGRAEARVGDTTLALVAMRRTVAAQTSVPSRETTPWSYGP